MPRPLIIKVEKKIGNSNNTMPNLINLKPARTINKPEVDKISSVERHHEPENTKSLVRNLINLYEHSNNPQTNLTKAKSLPHLPKSIPHLPKSNSKVRRRSEVEAPVQVKLEPKSDINFDFNKVWNKFETHSTSEKTVNSSKTSKTVRSTSVNSVQEKAKQILEEYKKINESLWRERVVALLKEICNVSDDEIREEKVTNETFTETEDTSTVTKKEKVKEIASLYERQSSLGSILTKPTPSYESYFSNIKAPEHLHVEEEGLSSSTSESDSSENSQGSYTFPQPSSNPSLKIMELKSYFEPSRDPYNRPDEDDDRMSTSTSITVLENGQIASSMENINSLYRQIEKLQNRINTISKGNIYEAPQINEELIQALVKLDDVETFGEGTLQAQRLKAIQLVQTCIRQLMDIKRS